MARVLKGWKDQFLFLVFSDCHTRLDLAVTGHQSDTRVGTVNKKKIVSIKIQWDEYLTTYTVLFSCINCSSLIIFFVSSAR